MGKTGKIGRAVHYVPSIVKASRRPWRAAPLAALLLLTLSALIALVASCVAPVPREAPAPLAGRTAPTAIPMPPTPVGDQTVSGEPAEAVTSPDHAAATRPQTQIRALWVDAFHDGIKTPAQVDKLVADAQLAGINTLIVQVRRRGDAYYNRTTEPRTADPALSPGFDALQRTIERAHAAEPPLEVHAWIATVALWNERDRPPADPHHAFNRHGPHAPGAENWISLDDSGAAWDGSNYMLDPGHPGATRYVAEVAAELVREYDIDGIHLDLVRYASARWGYNPVSVARYNRRHGTTGQPAPTDLRWQQWRRDQVTALVRRVYLDSLAVKPRVKVSAATIGWGSGPVDERTWRETSAYGSVFQDWISWLDEGIVDVVMPMTYDDEGDPVQQAWFDQWTAWQRQRKGRRHVAVGIGLFLNDPAGGLAQIRRALEPAASGLRLDGVALYSYAVSNAPPRGSETPATPNEELFRALAGPNPWRGDAPAPFATAAVPPPMPWKDNPGAHLRGTARSPSGPLDGAIIRLSGPLRATLRTDGNGYFGVPGLPPGSYAVTLEHGGAIRVHTVADLHAGRMLTLDLAVGE